MSQKIGVLFVGLSGGVATTSVLAAKAIAKEHVSPFGLYTETLMSTVRDGKLDRHNQSPIKEVLKLLHFEDVVFGGWDIEHGNLYEHAMRQKIIPEKVIEQFKEDLMNLESWPGVFSKDYIKNLDGDKVLQETTLADKASRIRQQIREFRERHQLREVIVINTASTEINKGLQEVHSSLQQFERGLQENDPSIGPAQVYAYAAIAERASYVNFTPSIAEDVPALQEFAEQMKVPLAGKDGKTGQTLLKTALAPIFRLKNLKVEGWFSTNILGNKDGLVLDDPGSLQSKIKTKSGVLKQILNYEPYHKVAINYYPPRGDEKEAWDNIDFLGVLGMPMQIKINFLCRDSVLAAGSVMDLIRLMEYCKRTGKVGVQEQLSFFFKCPTVPTLAGREAIHDFFKQEGMLKDWLREEAYGVVYR